MNSDVLIIDDDLGILRGLARFVRRCGIEAVLCAGLKDCIVTDGILQGLDLNFEPLPIDLSTIAIAYVDGIIGKFPPGWKVIPHLKAAGVYVVAMSGTTQEDLMKAGADAAVDKMHFPQFVSEGKFLELLDEARRLHAQRKRA